MVDEKGTVARKHGVSPSDRKSSLMSNANAISKPKLKRREAFVAAASDLDATFVQGKRASRDQVHLEHGPWNVILDTYVVNTGQVTVTYTRAHAQYVAQDDFTLRIARKNVFDRIGELFGFHGLLIGDQELEHKYKIKSSNEPRGRSFLMDDRLRELIMVQPSLRLDVQPRSWWRRRKDGDGVRAVTVQTTGVVRDPDRLANYVRVVAVTLDQLVKTGTARAEPVAEGRVYDLSRRA